MIKISTKFLCTKFLVLDLPQSFMHMPIMTLTTLWAIWQWPWREEETRNCVQQ